MLERAAEPFWAEAIGEWVVDVHYHYAPGEPVTVLHETFSFPTEDEAAAFVAETNGVLQ